MPRPRTSMTPKEQLSLLEARVTTAPAVPAIRAAVAEWRDGRYKGASATSRLLLNYWFKTDHRLPDGSMFRYHDAQRAALETLIYVSEVAGITRHRQLLERFAPNVPGIHILQYDEFSRFCIKMATGSGKTKAMAL